MDSYLLEATKIPGCNNISSVAHVDLGSAASGNASSCLIVGSRDGVHLLYHHGSLADDSSSKKVDRFASSPPSSRPGGGDFNLQFSPKLDREKTGLFHGVNAAAAQQNITTTAGLGGGGENASSTDTSKLLPVLESLCLIPAVTPRNLTQPSTSSAISGDSGSGTSLNEAQGGGKSPGAAVEDYEPVNERVIQSLAVLPVSAAAATVGNNNKERKKEEEEPLRRSGGKLGSSPENRSIDSQETHTAVAADGYSLVGGSGTSSHSPSTQPAPHNQHISSHLPSADGHISIILCVSYVTKPPAGGAAASRIKDGTVAFYYLRLYPVLLNRRCRCPSPSVRLILEIPYSNWCPLSVFPFPHKSMFLATSAGTAGKDGGQKWFHIDIPEAVKLMERSRSAGIVNVGIVKELTATEVSGAWPLLEAIAFPERNRLFAPIVSLDTWAPHNNSSQFSPTLLPTHLVVGCTDGSVHLFSESSSSSRGLKNSKKQLSSVVSSVRFFYPKKPTTANSSSSSAHQGRPGMSKAIDKLLRRIVEKSAGSSGQKPNTNAGPGGDSSLLGPPESEVRFGSTPTMGPSPPAPGQSNNNNHHPAVQIGKKPGSSSLTGPPELAKTLSIVALDTAGKVVLFHDVEVCELKKVSNVSDRVGLCNSLPTEDLRKAAGASGKLDSVGDSMAVAGPTARTAAATVSPGNYSGGELSQSVLGDSRLARGGNVIASSGAAGGGGSSFQAESLQAAPPIQALVANGPDRTVGSILGRGVLSLAIDDFDGDGYNEILVSTMGRRLALCHIQQQQPTGQESLTAGVVNPCSYEVVEPTSVSSHMFHIGFYDFFGVGNKTAVYCGPNAVWVGFKDIRAEQERNRGASTMMMYTSPPNTLATQQESVVGGGQWQQEQPLVNKRLGTLMTAFKLIKENKRRRLRQKEEEREALHTVTGGGGGNSVNSNPNTAGNGDPEDDDGDKSSSSDTDFFFARRSAAPLSEKGKQYSTQLGEVLEEELEADT